MCNKRVKLALGIAFLVAASPGVLSDDFELGWWTMDGGGDMWTTGSDFELSGTIGQPDANEFVMTGGDFELTGGFWVEAVVSQVCVGDIDGDGDTDHSDLGALLSAWGSQPGDPNWNEYADLDGDGEVGHSDLGILLGDWGCGM